MEKVINSEVLKTLGLDEKNEWMLYDDKAREFFEWCANNLDKDNILTENELAQYEAIKISGQFLEGDALTEELKALESYFPGILTLDEKEIEEKERELNFLNADTTSRTDRIDRMKRTEQKQMKQIEEIEKKRIAEEYQQKLLTEECVAKAKDVDEIKRSNLQKMDELRKSYIEPQNPSRFMHEMPLDQFYHQCEQFRGELENFLRKHLNVTSNPDEDGDDTNLNVTIAEVKTKIHTLKLKSFENELTAAGMENFIANIERIKLRARSDPNEMLKIIDDVEAENEDLSLQLEVAENEAKMLLKLSTENEITHILNKSLKEMSTTSLKQLDVLKSVQELIDNITALSELLSIAMHLDVERLKNRVDNSEEMSAEAEECDKRMRILEHKSKRDVDAECQQTFLKKIQDFLVRELRIERESVPNIEACLDEIVKIQDGNDEMMKACVEQETLKEFNGIISQIESQSEMLRDFIFRGPTNRPCLYDSKFSFKINEIEQQQKEMLREHELVKSNYRKNIVEPYENDRFFKMEKNLWIYFLTEPKKLLECIKEVQKKAAILGSSSFKAMNITMPKPT